ncbi:MAG: hypothetical protein GY799_07640 [Desulfobulbaceae bacterium]|nr:hypothetical protein [Desulfobulbaceae bacterium]
MTRPILLLRLSYWIAAMADFGIAVLAWMPERMGVTETVYPMGLTSAVAFSWGVLLLIADRKPLERRWILIPTILVVSLIALTRTKFALDGTIEFSIVLLLFAIALILLMAFSFYCANQNDTKT